MKVEAHDFRKPSRLAVEVEQQLAGWLSAGLVLVAERWGRNLPLPVTHTLEGIETVRPIDALAQFTETTVAFRVHVGSDRQQTLLATGRPLLLTLVAGMLGETCAEILADRDPTAVELSLVEFLLQQYFAGLQEAWPHRTPCPLALAEYEPAPQRARIFEPDNTLVRISLSMRGPFGEERLQWLVPQKILAGLFAETVDGPRAEQDTGVRGRLETFVSAMPLEVSVRLGGAVLHVAELARLRSGDVVLLDQLVSQPLAASVAGQTRFLVWPGRVGSKQAFRIESLAEF